MKIDHELSISFDGDLVIDADVLEVIGLPLIASGGNRDMHFAPPKAMSDAECGALKKRLEVACGVEGDFYVGYEAFTDDEDADSLTYDELTEEQRQ